MSRTPDERPSVNDRIGASVFGALVHPASRASRAVVRRVLAARRGRRDRIVEDLRAQVSWLSQLAGPDGGGPMRPFLQALVAGHYSAADQRFISRMLTIWRTRDDDQEIVGKVELVALGDSLPARARRALWSAGQAHHLSAAQFRELLADGLGRSSEQVDVLLRAHAQMGGDEHVDGLTGHDAARAAGASERGE